jgi:hypothetical protein
MLIDPNFDKNNEGSNLYDYKLILLLFFTYIEVISRGYYTLAGLVMLKIQVRVPSKQREPMQTLN